MRVVLPAPLGPSSAMISPRLTVRSIELTATTVPAARVEKTWRRERAEITVSAVLACCSEVLRCSCFYYTAGFRAGAVQSVMTCT